MRPISDRDLLKRMAGTQNGVFIKRPVVGVRIDEPSFEGTVKTPPPLAEFTDAELVEELRLRGALLMTHYTDAIPVELFSTYVDDKEFLSHRRRHAHSAMGAALEESGVDTLERRVDEIPNYVIQNKDRFYKHGRIEHQTTLVNLRVRRGQKS